MKWKFLNKTAAAVMSLLGINKIPMNGDASATEFTADQRKELEAKLGAEKTQKIIDAFDNELKAMNDADADLSAIDAELEVILAENTDATPDAVDDDPEDDEEEEDDDDDEKSDKKPKAKTTLAQKVAALTKSCSEKKKTIDALKDDGETLIKTLSLIAVRTDNVNLSTTLLYAVDKSFYTFESRPWNERLRDSSAKV